MKKKKKKKKKENRLATLFYTQPPPLYPRTLKYDDRTEYRATARRTPHKLHPGSQQLLYTQQRAEAHESRAHSALDNREQAAHHDSAPAPHENTPPSARSWPQTLASLCQQPPSSQYRATA
jgi:hypothetical protein